MKRLGLVSLLLAAMVFILFGYSFYQNNHRVAKASSAQIRESYELGVTWLLANRKNVLQDRNSILWWMIKESAELTHDERLKSLFAEFQATMTSAELNAVWQEFFKPGKYWGVNFPYPVYADYAAYQRYFLFSMTCGKELADDPIVVEQNDPGFCGIRSTINSTCVTHQLMAYRFMQRYGCDRVDGLSEKVNVLQNRIQRQLTWDPRVADVYLQRVLMLVDSGAADKVKPVWLERIFRAQLPDGSWSGRQPLVYLGNENYLSVGNVIYRIYPGKFQGSFHTTAQGIWLMSLLQQEKNYAALSAASM